jgi:hypothetical protein
VEIMRELERIKARYSDASASPGPDDGSAHSGEHIVLGPAAAAAAAGLGAAAGGAGAGGDFGTVLSSGSCPVSITGGGTLTSLGGGVGSRTGLAPWGLPVIQDEGEEGEDGAALSGGGHARASGPRTSVAAVVKMWENGSGGQGGSGDGGGGTEDTLKGMSSVYFDDCSGSSHAHRRGGAGAGGDDAGATLTEGGGPTLTDVLPLPAGTPLSNGAVWLQERARAAAAATPRGVSSEGEASPGTGGSPKAQ